jgi:hypothetical protein
MASQNKVIEIIAGIKTLYPYYAKDTNKQVLVKMWNALLQEYTDEIVDKAFYKCLQVCKMPPTPADIIEQINRMNKAGQKSEYELWDIYRKALRETQRQMHYFQYTYVDATGVSQGDQARKKVEDIWNGLPEELKVYIASKGEMMLLAQNSTDDDLKFEKQRFMKTLPTLAQRIADKKLLLDITNNKNLIGFASGEE